MINLTHGAFRGVFKNWGLILISRKSPVFACNQLINRFNRHFRSSKRFQKMRINPHFLKIWISTILWAPWNHHRKLYIWFTNGWNQFEYVCLSFLPRRVLVLVLMKGPRSFKESAKLSWLSVHREFSSWALKMRQGGGRVRKAGGIRRRRGWVRGW